jgi:glycosyltransferase involved in cell wall biosynthesis
MVSSERLRSMKKKLLLVGRGNEIGGGTEYLITLIKMLKENFDVEIHMTYGRQEIKENYMKYFDYVTFHQIQMVRSINPIADYRSIRQLVTLIKDENFDVVHTNSSKGGVVGRIAAQISKVPFVFHTVHGFAFHEQSTKITIAIYSLFERIAASCCNYIITVNDFHKAWAIKLKIATEDKIISIPNGLNPNRVIPKLDKEQIRGALKMDGDEIAIFTIGRLEKQKGIEDLLEAVALLKKEEIGDKYQFYIAGSGKLEKPLKDKASTLKLEDKVKFLGYRADVNDLLVAADIIVLPSLREGLSIALLEAMAARKAIICTDIGSNRTVIENKKEALVVKSKNPIELKNSMKLLIQNKHLREKISEEAYNKYILKFTNDIMLKKYYEFYKDKAKLSEKVKAKNNLY